MDPVGGLPRGSQNSTDLGEPLGVFNQSVPINIRCRLAVTYVAQFLVAISHRMNVLDVTKLQRGAIVIRGILVTVALGEGDGQV